MAGELFEQYANMTNRKADLANIVGRVRYDVGKAARQGKTMATPTANIGPRLDAFVSFINRVNDLWGISIQDEPSLGLWAIAFLEGREFEKAHHYPTDIRDRLLGTLRSAEHVFVVFDTNHDAYAVMAVDESQLQDKMRVITPTTHDTYIRRSDGTIFAHDAYAFETLKGLAMQGVSGISKIPEADYLLEPVQHAANRARGLDEWLYSDLALRHKE